jgi:hypothetical protein
MKKVLVLLVGLGLVISCDKEEALDDSPSTFETTSIMALIESGNNDASRDVNRPGSVLDFINTIEITADHVGTIGAPYEVSEEYTMVDDGSGASGFVLEDVALGMNEFKAYAKSYNQISTEEYLWIDDQADMPWEWIDAQRGRHPNVNFYDNDNARQLIKENPAVGENLVNFDMQAESGRLIVGVKLSDEIRNTFFSNFVNVQHQVTYADGSLSGWSGMTQFNDLQKDKLLTFYFSDNDKSITGACVEFKFTICDRISGATNTFFREICIENGKSIGCVYEVTGDAVVEDITNFNFTFNWEEVDCDPCTSNNYVTTVPSYPHVQGEMLTLCGTEVGTVHEITTLVPNLLEDGQYSVQLVMNVDGSTSDVLMVSNGTSSGQSVTWTLNGTSNGGFTIAANTVTLVKLGDNTDVTNFVVGSTSGENFTTGSIADCN